MPHCWSRRTFVSFAPLSFLGVSTLTARAWAQPVPVVFPSADAFPAQDPALVKDVVAASHGNIKRVQELVSGQPALACASIDWGFGDWESCIDAAAHVGHKPIVELLLANGARPTIFSAAMLGQLDVVKAFCAARPGLQSTYGPHGITLMSHARAGGPDAAAVVQYLATLGGADTPLPSTPLAPADRDALVGTYVYGPGARDHFTVDVQQDRLGLDRPGGPSRRLLLHTGNLVFFPTGVPSVTIAFARGGGRVTGLTVAAPGVTVTARRQ